MPRRASRPQAAGKKHEEEEHENHERWLVSYADMVTLLMCLFIVLFAMSQVDKAKFAALASGPVGELRRPDHRPARRPRRRARCSTRCPAPSTSPRPSRRTRRSAQAEVDAAAAAGRRRAGRARRRRGRRAPTTSSPPPATQIEAALTAAGYAGAARFEIDERGLVVHIVADAVLFDAEQAVLRPEGRAILDAVAPDADRPAQRAARRGPRQPPAGHAGRPVAVELGAVGLPGHAPCCATWPATASPSPACPPTGYSSTRPLVPDHRPERHHRQPAGRHRRPVHRLGRGQRAAAGHRRQHTEEARHETRRRPPRPTRRRRRAARRS